MASNNNRKRSVKEYVEEWNSGKNWIDQFTRDFPEIDNLVDGVPINHSDKAPFVGSVTLGSALRMIARSAVQQLPTFSVEVNGTKRSTNAVFAKYIVRRIIFNQDTFGKGILSSIQLSTLESLAHGFKAVVATLGKTLGDYGTVMQPIHYDDIVVEPGIFDFNESGHWDVRTRVTKSRIKRLIKIAEKNPESSWVVEALEELIAKGPSDDSSYKEFTSDPKTPSGAHTSNTFDLITRYEAGPFADIITFSPQITDKPLRVMKSRSKFGYPRVTALVIDPSMLSPFGDSRARLATPLTNYENIYLQSTAKMQLLNADPPVFQKGQFTTPIRLKRGALWQALDPQAEVKLQELSNSTLNQFQTVLQFIDNQIYSVLGVTPGNVGAQKNSGVYQNNAQVSMEKNVGDVANLEVVNIVENFLRQYALTALDLYVSEQEGKEDVIIDDEAKDEINTLAQAAYVPQPDPNDPTGMTLLPFDPPVKDDNILKIDWEVFYDSIKSWTVDIDLSMAKDALDAKKRADAQDMLTVVSQTTDPNDPNAMARKSQLEDVMIEKTFPEMARKQPQAPQPAPVEAPFEQ